MTTRQQLINDSPLKSVSQAKKYMRMETNGTQLLVRLVKWSVSSVFAILELSSALALVVTLLEKSRV